MDSYHHLRSLVEWSIYRWGRHQKMYPSAIKKFIPGCLEDILESSSWWRWALWHKVCSRAGGREGRLQWRLHREPSQSIFDTRLRSVRDTVWKLLPQPYFSISVLHHGRVISESETWCNLEDLDVVGGRIFSPVVEDFTAEPFGATRGGHEPLVRALLQRGQCPNTCLSGTVWHASAAASWARLKR